MESERDKGRRDSGVIGRERYIDGEKTKCSNYCKYWSHTIGLCCTTHCTISVQNLEEEISFENKYLNNYKKEILIEGFEN